MILLQHRGEKGRGSECSVGLPTRAVFCGTAKGGTGGLGRGEPALQYLFANWSVRAWLALENQRKECDTPGSLLQKEGMESSKPICVCESILDVCPRPPSEPKDLPRALLGMDLSYAMVETR